MTPSASLYLYICIPVTNCAGNLLLKLSIEKKAAGKRRAFALLQLAGYGAFLVTMLLCNLFLMANDASQMIAVFTLNYLTTLHASRLFFDDPRHLRDLLYDAVVVLGIAIFFFGCRHDVFS